MKTQPLHVVYATDRGYLLPTIVAACSAAYWTSDAKRVVVDILDCGLGDEDWENLCRKVSRVNAVALKRHVIDMSRFDGYRIWNNSRGIYARLLLPDILKDVDWCVYCDGDTLFTDDPLKLLDYCDDQYALVGHEDNDNSVQAKWFPEHGYEWDPSQYVCAGFILQNLKWMRENDGVRRLFDFIEKYRPPFNDQDAFYAVCRGHVRQLKDGWGVFGYLATSETMRGCIHYASDQPWKLKYTVHRGILDIKKLWFLYAQKLAGYRLDECVGKSGAGRYRVHCLVSEWFKLVFGIVAIIPGLRHRAAVYQRQVFSRVMLAELIQK